ncbi:MAG: hypothetical protein R2729_14515 [Bryobacteraceae bacterium]
MILLLLQKIEESQERPRAPLNGHAVCPTCGSRAVSSSVSDRPWLDAALLIAGVGNFQCRVCNDRFRSPGRFEVRLAANGLSVRSCAD